MKRLNWGMIIAITFGILFYTGIMKMAMAEDIVKSEVMPDVVRWKQYSVKILAFTQTCIIKYRKVDASNNLIGSKRIIFQNVVEDPKTPELEYDNSFTQLINLINNESNIKSSITKAVKIKLGINK